MYIQRSWVYFFRCMEKYTTYISWVYQITQEGQYLSTIHLNPKLNFNVNCIKHVSQEFVTLIKGTNH